MGMEVSTPFLKFAVRRYMSGLLYVIHLRSDSLVCQTGTGRQSASHKAARLAGMVSYHRHFHGEFRPVHVVSEDCTIGNESFR